MKNTISISLLALLIFPARSVGQNAPTPPPNAPSSQTAIEAASDVSKNDQRAADPPSFSGPIDSSPARRSPANAIQFGLSDKFRYYMTETYFNLGALTAPAFRAGLRLANPPGKGATRYPPEWRRGAEAFGRNYGDAFSERISFQTARFVTGAVTRENPSYLPSSSHNIFARSVHALSFSFVDRSDSGHPMPALSNFVGAAAGGFVGNTYLPAGFNDVTHAAQRATIRFGTFAAGNLFREFAPQMPHPVRTFFMLIVR
jgi:hypothetical protein